MNKIIIAIVAIVVLVGAGIWFVQNNSSAPASIPSTGTVTKDNQGNPDYTPPATGTEKDFTVTGENFSFSPATLTVQKGDHVKITFINSGGTHDLRIDEFNAKTYLLKSGEQATVEFTADKTGTFEYYCSVGNHRAMGMKGTLTVTQ